MIIHQPDVTHRDGEVRVSARLEFNDKQGYELPDRFWFSVPEAYESFITDRIDPFVTALFSVAMLLNEPLEVRGVMSSRLGFGLQQIQRICNHFDPQHFHIVDILPQGYEPVPPVEGDRATAMTFSGGVDSFYVLWSLTQHDTPADPDLTHIIFMRNLDITPQYPHLYSSALSRYTGLAEQLGLELLTIASNWQHTIDVHYKLIGHDAYSLGFMLGAMGQMLGGAISRLILPSNMDYSLLIPSGFHHAIAAYFSTETLDVYDYGSHRTRHQKIRDFAEWSLAFNNLRVCLHLSKIEDGQFNCCRCKKCLSTMALLESMGLLDRYSTFPKAITLAAIWNIVTAKRAIMAKRVLIDALPGLRRRGRWWLFVWLQIGLSMNRLYLPAFRLAYNFRERYKQRRRLL